MAVNAAVANVVDDGLDGPGHQESQYRLAHESERHYQECPPVIRQNEVQLGGLEQTDLVADSFFQC